MNSFLTVAILLAGSAVMALGAPVSPAASEQNMWNPTQEESQHVTTLHRVPRQLSASSSLANAIGGGVGLLPLIGSSLQAPVTSLLQPSLSSSLSSLTGGLVNRLGPYPDFGQLQYWGRSLAQPQYSYQYQPSYRSFAGAPFYLAQ